MEIDFYSSRVFANKFPNIDLNKLEFIERQTLFLKENIIVKRNVDFSKPYLDSAIRNNKLIERTHSINPEIYKEIIADFLFTHESLDLDAEIFKINLKVRNALDDEMKINILKKCFEKYLKKINKLDLYYWYNLSDKEFEEYGERNFHHHIQLELKDEYVYMYLSNEYVSYYKIPPFDQWIKILDLEYLINHCKKDLEKLSSEINQKLLFNTKSLNENHVLNKIEEQKEKEHTENNIKTQENIESNYPLVFKNLKSENIFKKFLLHANAVDSNFNAIDRKFFPPCDAFFTVSLEYDFKKFNVFKYNVDKQDFVNMINKEFKKNITKLSDGKKHQHIAQEFYSDKSNFV